MHGSIESPLQKLKGSKLQKPTDISIKKSEGSKNPILKEFNQDSSDEEKEKEKDKNELSTQTLRQEMSFVVSHKTKSYFSRQPNMTRQEETDTSVITESKPRSTSGGGTNPIFLGFRIDKIETKVKELGHYGTQMDDLRQEITSLRNELQTEVAKRSKTGH